MDDENYIVYILYSKKFDKTYVGYTKNLIGRFYSHNFLATKGYTIRYRPWEVMHVEVCDSKKQAMKIEKFYKSGIGRDQIKIIKSDYLKNN